MKISARGRTSQSEMAEALELAASGGISLRQISRERNIPFATLRRHWIAIRHQFEIDKSTRGKPPNYEKHGVFTKDEEDQLVEFIQKDMSNAGDNVKLYIKLKSYEYALLNNIHMPKAWRNAKCADYAWVHHVISKYPYLIVKALKDEGSSEDNTRTLMDNVKDYDIQCYTSMEEYSDDGEHHPKENHTDCKKADDDAQEIIGSNDALNRGIVDGNNVNPGEFNFVAYDNSNYENTIINIWGTKFLKLPKDQKIFAEKAINDILFEAQMGNLTRDAIKINK